MENENNFNITFFKELDKYNWDLISQNPNDFVEQLKKEITKNHFLFDKELTAIAKNNANDDILFVEKNIFYIVHLTYTSTNETGFPKYEIFENIQEVEQYFSKNYIDF